MAGAERHRLVRGAPRSIRGRVKGQPHHCTCGAMWMGSFADVARLHAQHVAELPDERAQRLAEIAREAAELEAKLAALRAA